MVGYSGGGGLIIMIAEALPDGVKLNNAVLVHAAISPDYNLVPALEHIDGKLVNSYSPGDWLVLGLGTRLFGTTDREHTESAGKVGFVIEKAVTDVDLRAKVEQIKWSREMISSGHLGGHATINFYKWNKEYVVPYLLPENQRSNIK